MKAVMTEQTNAGKRKEQETIGQVRLPYITDFSEQFKKIAQKHKFEVTLLPGVKLKSLKNRCQIPLGDQRSGVVYQIPCEYVAVYTGETKRKFETRLNEHKKKVQLVSMDVESRNIEAAMWRMEGEDGGLAIHAGEESSGKSDSNRSEFSVHESRFLTIMTNWNHGNLSCTVSSVRKKRSLQSNW